MKYTELTTQALWTKDVKLMEEILDILEKKDNARYKVLVENLKNGIMGVMLEKDNKKL